MDAMLVTINDHTQNPKEHTQHQSEEKATAQFTYKKWPWKSFLITALCLGTIFFTAGSPSSIQRIEGPSLVLCAIFIIAGSVLLIPSAIIVIFMCLVHILKSLGCPLPKCCYVPCGGSGGKRKKKSKRVGRTSLVLSEDGNIQESADSESVTVWTVDGDSNIRDLPSIPHSDKHQRDHIPVANYNNNNLIKSSINDPHFSTVQVTIEPRPRSSETKIVDDKSDSDGERTLPEQYGRPQPLYYDNPACSDDEERFYTSDTESLTQSESHSITLYRERSPVDEYNKSDPRKQSVRSADYQRHDRSYDRKRVQPGGYVNEGYETDDRPVRSSMTSPPEHGHYRDDGEDESSVYSGSSGIGSRFHGDSTTETDNAPTLISKYENRKQKQMDTDYIRTKGRLLPYVSTSNDKSDYLKSSKQHYLDHSQNSSFRTKTDKPNNKTLSKTDYMVDSISNVDIGYTIYDAERGLTKTASMEMSHSAGGLLSSDDYQGSDTLPWSYTSYLDDGNLELSASSFMKGYYVDNVAAGQYFSDVGHLEFI